MTEFYYNRKKLRNWAIFSILLLVFALWFPASNLAEIVWLTIVKIIVLISAMAAFYVFMNPQRLAKIDDEGIEIDHNAKLKWKDVEALERVGGCCKCCCCGRSFLRFKLKKGVKYPLTFMQKMSAASKYGAFSIPLYAMTIEDGEAIEKEIAKHLSAPKAKAETKKKAPKKVVKPAAKKAATKKVAPKKKAPKKAAPKK